MTKYRLSTLALALVLATACSRESLTTAPSTAPPQSSSLVAVSISNVTASVQRIDSIPVYSILFHLNETAGKGVAAITSYTFTLDNGYSMAVQMQLLKLPPGGSLDQNIGFGDYTGRPIAEHITS